MSAALGIAAALGAAACGEDDRGGVEVEGAGTGTTGGGGAETVPTGTTESAPEAGGENTETTR